MQNEKEALLLELKQVRMNMEEERQTRWKTVRRTCAMKTFSVLQASCIHTSGEDLSIRRRAMARASGGKNELTPRFKNYVQQDEEGGLMCNPKSEMFTALERASTRTYHWC